MKLSRISAALVVAGLLGAMASANASISFKFNPFGTGDNASAIAGAFTIDQAPGSTVALDGVNLANPGAPLPNGTVLTNYYQANLNSILGAGSTVLYSNGTGSGGNYFTFAATYTETVVGGLFVPGVFSFSQFQVNGGTFKMCAQNALGNDLAGTGFGCAGNGILSGTITGGTANVSADLTETPLPLDGNGLTNDWPGVTSLVTSGGARIGAELTFVDAGFFPDLDAAGFLELILTNSSLITPFDQVDPSRRFTSNLISDDYAASIGALNGVSGPDFLFQADANTSFDRVAVPEPASIALVGLALLGLAATSRRRVK